MSTKIAERVVKAWLERRRLTASNTWTDGHAIVLYNTTIAKRELDGSIWITVGNENTQTTRDRLNAIPGVAVCQDRGKLFLNMCEWDGEWTKIQEVQP